MKLKDLAMGSLLFLSGYASANGLEANPSISNLGTRTESLTQGPLKTSGHETIPRDYINSKEEKRFQLRDNLNLEFKVRTAPSNKYFSESSRFELSDKSPSLKYTLSPIFSAKLAVGGQKGLYDERLRRIFRDKTIATVSFRYRWE